jgi:mevalonate kinase
MEKLIDAAWNAGALGAKITGVGRAMIALTTPAARRTVADIMTAAGGVALTPELPAHGARVEEEG